MRPHRVPVPQNQSDVHFLLIPERCPFNFDLYREKENTITYGYLKKHIE
jgi:hypothetical protein